MTTKRESLADYAKRHPTKAPGPAAWWTQLPPDVVAEVKKTVGSGKATMKHTINWLEANGYPGATRSRIQALLGQK